MIRPFMVFLLAVIVPVSLAHSQSRDVYTVRGITVDESAESVIAAKSKAFESAKIIGARRMLQRITLPQDLVTVGGGYVEADTAQLLAAAVDVEEETAGAGRYRGRLAVVFNPATVRNYLAQNNIPYIDQQAAKAVILPIAQGLLAEEWSQTWPDTSQGRLVPTQTSRTSGYTLESDWAELRGEVAFAGAKRAIIAEVSGIPGAYRARLVSVTAAGTKDLGSTPPAPELSNLVTTIGAQLDQDWKKNAIVRETGRTLIEATVLYTSLPEWNTLRQALARSPLVSDFQTKAVSTDGAVVAFIFAGDGQRLTSDLGDRGVQISQESIGWVLSSAISGRNTAE